MRIFILILVAALASCAQTPNNFDTVASLTAVNDTFNREAAEHNAAGLVGLYADETVWIEAGKRPTIGLEGPTQLFEFVAANEGSVTHTIDHLYVADDATLAVMIGSVEAKIESAGMDATGTYLFVLEPDHQDWKVVVDMWHQHDQ